MDQKHRRLEADAAATAQPDVVPSAPNPPGKKKASTRIPSADAYLRARATPIVNETIRNGGFVTKAAVVRQLREELAPELADLERRREAQRRLEEAARLPDPARVRASTRSPRRSFYEVAEPPQQKKSDQRRLRREARIQREAAVQQEVASSLKSTSPQECVAAARQLMANKEKGNAARLLAGAAHHLAPQDPVRFDVAAELGKADAARAVGVLTPLIGHEQHGERAEAMLAVMQLAQGQSRVAVELLSRTDRAALKTLKAAAELSWAIRTSDDAACDRALEQLAEARFSNKGQVLAVHLGAYPGMPEQVRLCAGTLKYANHLGEGLLRAGRLHEAVAIYDTVLGSKPRPACSSERREVIRALKSSGKAYYEYGVANRKALGQVSLPDAPSTAWNMQAQHQAKTARIGLAETADRYLNRAFERLYHAFELNGTDDKLRNDLAKVIELTGNPHQFERVNERVHRRQKSVAVLLEAPDSNAVIQQLQRLSAQEELSGQEARLLRDLHRNRQASLRVEQQRQELMELMTHTREVSDKPAHMPSGLSRQRRAYQAPRR